MKNIGLDKTKVLNWLQKHALGHNNARKREDIIPFIGLSDRYFREIFSFLRHERKVSASSIIGYWAIPDKLDENEIAMILKSCNENYSRALDLITGCKEDIKYWEDKKLMVNGGQWSLIFDKKTGE